MLDRLPQELVNWHFVKAHIMSHGQMAQDPNQKPAESVEEFEKIPLRYLGEKVLFKNYSIAEMAEQCYMTPVTFKRKFLKEYGEPPHKWLLRQRLGHASRLLKYTKLSIKEVCYRCDFSTPSNFSRAFKTAYGCTPEEYRAKGYDKTKVTRLTVHLVPRTSPTATKLSDAWDDVPPFELITFNTRPLHHTTKK